MTTLQRSQNCDRESRLPSGPRNQKLVARLAESVGREFRGVQFGGVMSRTLPSTRVGGKRNPRTKLRRPGAWKSTFALYSLAQGSMQLSVPPMSHTPVTQLACATQGWPVAIFGSHLSETQR